MLGWWVGMRMQGHVRVSLMRHAQLTMSMSLVVWLSARLLSSRDRTPRRLPPPFVFMAVVVFAGQSCSEEHHGDSMRRLAEQVRRAAVELGEPVEDTRIFFAPETTGRMWAVYEPSPEEIASCGGNWWAAERGPRRVPALSRDLHASAMEAWAGMDDAFEQFGPLLLCGCSNGCVVATEYATTHPERVRALLLFSGLPSLAQQWRVAEGLKRVPPACLTMGSRERYFGGRDSFESVAADFACPLLGFEGGHCREDEDAIVGATRLALQARSSVSTAAQ